MMEERNCVVCAHSEIDDIFCSLRCKMPGHYCEMADFDGLYLGKILSCGQIVDCPDFKKEEMK